jgi:alanine dehydrogenase
MDARAHRLTVGLPRMHKEPGERRDFLPPLVHAMARAGADVVVQTGIGSGMGLADHDYLQPSGSVRVADHRSAYGQDVVLVLRAPNDHDLRLLRPGATLVSMLHFPTRPGRVRRLIELGVEGIALDCIVDDRGMRLVEDARAVAWNGLEAAFDALEATHPGMTDPDRAPIRVTLMGSGAIGRHAVDAAVKYGSLARFERFERMGLPGVEVVTAGRNLTRNASYMRERLRRTDILVDSTQRHDASVPLVPNRWIELLPMHAVICDLVVDVYQPTADPPTVRGIEGIPQGSLDQYMFGPDDPAWDLTVPPEIPRAHRRTVVSCYSWPGLHPLACMEVYGSQLAPLMETLVRRGGAAGLRADRSVWDRALLRATLRSLRSADAAPPPVGEPRRRPVGISSGGRSALIARSESAVPSPQEP